MKCRSRTMQPKPTDGMRTMWESRARWTLGGLCALVVALWWTPNAAAAAEITGQVRLVTPAGQPAKERMRVLVYYTPDGASPKLQRPTEPFELTMARKQFQPSSLIVPLGSTVRFPNDDTILHNVFSVSGSNRFDLGIYRQGTGKETTFEYPGVVRVFCNVHHSMVAHVVVVNTPYYGTTDAEGRFRLQDIPKGKGTLNLWFERSDEWRQAITVPTAQGLAIDLVVSKGKLPPHRNKFNKPYKRRRRDKAYN